MRYDMFDIHNPNHEDLLDLIQFALDSTKEAANGQPYMVSLGVLDKRTTQIYGDYLNSLRELVGRVANNVSASAKHINQDIQLKYKQLEYYNEGYSNEDGGWVVEPTITVTRKVIKNEDNY